MSTTGQRIHRVRFEDPGVPIPDGDGGYTQAWTVIQPEFWKVAIRPATARDVQQSTGEAVTAAASHVATGAWRPLTTKARMVRVKDGRIFQINGVNNDDELDVSMTLFCTELLDA